MDKSKFSIDFRTKREEMGLNQKQLGKLIAVSPTSVQNYETPEHNSFPRPHRWKRIKEVMGIDPQGYRGGGVVVSGNQSVGKINAMDHATVSAGCNYTRMQPESSGELMGIEREIFATFRRIGSPVVIAEKCLQKLRAIESMIG